MSKTREPVFYHCRLSSEDSWTIGYWNGVYWVLPEREIKVHASTFEECYDEIDERRIVREEPRPNWPIILTD